MARREPYSEREISMLISMRNDGMFFKDIGQVLGRTESSIARAHTRITGEVRGRCTIGLVGGRSTWTPERDEQLKALRWAGTPFTHIGDKMGMSATAVTNRANALKFKINPALLTIKNKPIQTGPSQRQLMKRSESQRTPEARLHAQYQHLKHDCAPAGKFWHLISNEPWPGVTAHG